MEWFEPVSSASEHCCPIHCAKGIADLVQIPEKTKNSWQGRDSNPYILRRKSLSWLTVETRFFCLITRQNIGKKGKRPYWVNIFRTYLKNVRKNNTCILIVPIVIWFELVCFIISYFTLLVGNKMCAFGASKLTITLALRAVWTLWFYSRIVTWRCSTQSSCTVLMQFRKFDVQNKWTAPFWIIRKSKQHHNWTVWKKLWKI